LLAFINSQPSGVTEGENDAMAEAFHLKVTKIACNYHVTNFDVSKWRKTLKATPKFSLISLHLPSEFRHLLVFFAASVKTIRTPSPKPQQ
jgi:hypothetical protein